jgi:hypothetical protein
MSKVFEFNDLSKQNLIVGSLYRGGNFGDVRDDPISKLLSCGNQGGFRISGSTTDLNLNYVVLYSSLSDSKWPDHLDEKLGHFTYFGDNKSPGKELLDTRKKGNLILKQCFDVLQQGQMDKIPPFFIFTKSVNGRDVIFRGLAVPGVTGNNHLEEVMNSTEGAQFINYKAMFTIIDTHVITREWIDELERGIRLSDNAPKAWIDWLSSKVYKPVDEILEIDNTIEISNTEREQIVKTRVGQSSFKRGLIKKDSKCKICGISNNLFLIASHIKPWSKSTHVERMDLNNGFLLCPNHDILFDRGFIAFQNDGSIICSKLLDDESKVFLNISDLFKIELDEQQKNYIHWHRHNVFLDSK